MASSGLPGTTLDSLKLFIRNSATDSPSKVTVSNLRLIKRSIDDLILSGELKPTRSSLDQATYLKTVLDIPFVDNFVLPVRKHDQLCLNDLGDYFSSSTSYVAALSKRSYFSIGTSSNGLLRWNSNPRYTDWEANLPGTAEIWLYMDTSTGYTFGSSWIFHSSSSFSFRIKDATGEIGCSHLLDSNNSFSTFVSHFPSFVQYDVWIHLACVYKTSVIDFAYNEHFDTHTYTLPNTLDPQTANDRFSFGFPGSMPIYFHEARVWRSARSHG